MLVRTARGAKHYKTVWMENSSVKMIDQLLLPHKFEVFTAKNVKETAAAIKTMVVRGAGAIGVTAAYGVAQAALQADKDNFFFELRNAAQKLRETRPTAQNLFHGVNEVLDEVKRFNDPKKAKAAALRKAKEFAQKEMMACKRIGEKGEHLITNGARVLTHCNAGWLAFVDYGSALAPLYAAKRSGKKFFVFVDETRPRLQGAKLTAWELANEGIEHAIIADNAAGHFMQRGEVDLVIVGADRIALNGDSANKIGTYEKAVLAKENGIPFYVAAPLSTFDANTEKGEKIPIEERNGKEVLFLDEKLVANRESKARNPAFDVTPAKYIAGIITEKGIVKAQEEEIKKLLGLN
ncbi:MAG: S-methyl-5-thioribose-1-phosphate isomerase [Candidatus Diapherotrites archaeon]